MNGVYRLRLLLAALVLLSAVALVGFWVGFWDPIPKNDHFQMLLWYGPCGVGVGLGLASVAWLVRTDDPVTLDYLEASLGVLLAVSSVYLAYAIRNGLPTTDPLVWSSLYTFIVSLVALSLLVVLQPRADTGRIYAARVLFAVLIPASFVVVIAFGDLFGGGNGAGEGIGAGVFVAFIYLCFGLAGWGCRSRRWGGS